MREEEKGKWIQAKSEDGFDCLRLVREEEKEIEKILTKLIDYVEYQHIPEDIFITYYPPTISKQEAIIQLIEIVDDALQAQRAELLEKLPKEGDLVEASKKDSDYWYGKGFNQCLSEVKKIIEEV